MSDSMVGRVIFNVMRVSFLAIVLSLFAIAYFLNKDYLDLQHWHKTQAKVFSSQVVEKRVKILDRLAISYDMEVEYAYIVDKKRYDSNSLFAFNKTPKTLPKDYFLQQSEIIKAGALVDVYYNPESPENSYLILAPEGGSMAFYESILVLLYIALGLFAIQPLISYYNYRQGKTPNNTTFEFIIPQNARRISARKRDK
jgi:hypothetical protein